VTSRSAFIGLIKRLKPAGFLPVFTALKTFLNRPDRTGLKLGPAGPDRFKNSGPVTTLVERKKNIHIYTYNLLYDIVHIHDEL